MGRVYTAIVNAVAVTAIQDFWELNCPTDAVICLLSVRISQYSDVGDAAAEMLPVVISKATGTAGSGGTTPTAQPHHTGDSAFGGTVEANNDTQAGTTVEELADAFNIRAGWLYQPTEKEYKWLSPGEVLLVELPVAPTDSLTMMGSITFKVFGG